MYFGSTDNLGVPLYRYEKKQKTLSPVILGIRVANATDHQPHASVQGWIIGFFFDGYSVEFGKFGFGGKSVEFDRFSKIRRKIRRIQLVFKPYILKSLRISLRNRRM